MTDNHPIVQSAIRAANLGQKKKARKILEYYLAKDPGNAFAWYILAHLAQTHEEAIKYLEKVIELEPGNQKALQKLQKIKNAPKDLK